MTHTELFKNEAYLIITSLVSIAVLGGYEYFELALATLLILPVINFPTRNTLNKPKRHSTKANKCTSC